MSGLLCASPRCRPPGRHRTDCQAEPDTPCRGCLPAQAADGLRLCWHCTDRLGPDAMSAAQLWTDTGMVLAGHGGDEYGIRQRNPGQGINLNVHVAEHRAVIRHTLVSWTQLICEERGVGLPCRPRLARLPDGVQGPLNRVTVVDDSTAALGRFVARHAHWLAAQDFAGETADELAELAAKGRSLLQPSGTKVVQIGPCPQTIDDGERRCPGMLRALLRREASLLPSAVRCDADETHSWDSTQWMKLGRAMNGKVA